MNLLAQNLDTIQSKSGINIPFSTDNTALLLARSLPYVFGAAGIVLILNIIVSGYQLMVSAGDPKAAQAAQQKITTSVIGTMIIAGSFFIVQLILSFLGVNMTIFK